MTRENAIKIVNDYFNKQFVPIDLSEAIDILTAVSPVSQRFVEPSKELNNAAEEYAQDEMVSGLAERAFKAGAEWQREQYGCIPAEEAYMRGFAQGAKEERKDLAPLINRLCEAILFERKDAAELASKTLTQIKAREE